MKLDFDSMSKITRQFTHGGAMTKPTSSVEFDTEKARFNMIEQQIRPWNVLDKDILDLVASVPRELFVPEAYQARAFGDCRIPLAHQQTMLAPKEDAKILQALKVKPTDKVLEVGTGSGYLTALLAKQTETLYSVDIIPEFVNTAQSRLEELEITTAHLEVADAASGWEHHGPYDVIVITGSLPSLPDSFRHSLKDGGRLFAFLGDAPAMSAALITRLNEHEWHQESLYETVVERLINAAQENAFVF